MDIEFSGLEVRLVLVAEGQSPGASRAASLQGRDGCRSRALRLISSISAGISRTRLLARTAASVEPEALQAGPKRSPGEASSIMVMPAAVLPAGRGKLDSSGTFLKNVLEAVSCGPP